MYDDLIKRLEADLDVSRDYLKNIQAELRLQERRVMELKTKLKKAQENLNEKRAGLGWIQSHMEGISKEKQETGLFASNGSVFPFDGTSAEKLIFAIRKIGRFTHKSKIEEVIQGFQPQDSEHWYSNSLHGATKSGKIERINYNDSYNYFFYGLAEWVDIVEGEKVIKDPQFMPAATDLVNVDPDTMVFK